LAVKNAWKVLLSQSQQATRGASFLFLQRVAALKEASSGLFLHVTLSLLVCLSDPGYFYCMDMVFEHTWFQKSMPMLAL